MLLMDWCYQGFGEGGWLLGQRGYGGLGEGGGGWRIGMAADWIFTCYQHKWGFRGSRDRLIRAKETFFMDI